MYLELFWKKEKRARRCNSRPRHCLQRTIRTGMGPVYACECMSRRRKTEDEIHCGALNNICLVCCKAEILNAALGD